MGIFSIVSDPRDGSMPSVAAQYAQLFGLECRFWNRNEVPEDAQSKPGDAVVALNYRTLRSLDAGQIAKLRNFIRGGAMLYVRGGFAGQERCTLWPLADASFSCAPVRSAAAYRIESHHLVPEVLYGEEGAGDFSLLSAADLSGKAQPLASARFHDYEWMPFLFSVACGAGTIICDLLPDAPIGSVDLPIFNRLADPMTRHAELGALATLRIGAGMSPKANGAVNLIVDDRPANFDYLTTRKLQRWLRHVDSHFPGAHVDFAWTPDQLRPARSYVETLKQFNTGFVWHGFKRHINHRKADNLKSDLRDGTAMVERISREFGVRFQPIMVFPFEAFGLEAIPLLEQGGFLATFANRLAPEGMWSPFPPFMDYSTPLHEQFTGLFPVLRRSTCETLSRNRMIALAALDLPIIAVIHPDEIGLRRWPYPPLAQGSPDRCDKLLSFAAARRMKPQSLEEIAQNLRARVRPQIITTTETYNSSARYVH